MDILGDSALGAADVNIIFQTAVLVVLAFGVQRVRIGKLEHHGRLMKSAMIAQFGAIVLWMSPSLLLNLSALTELGPGQLITILHVFSATIASALAAMAAFHRNVITRSLRWTMWATLSTWAIAAALGFAFYTYYFLL